MIDSNYYLARLDKELLLDKTEKEKIDKSIGFIKQKFWALFQERLSDVKIFGSYPKETFISKDSDSDVDILVVFKNKEFQPQTYLNQLKIFANDYYSKSNIFPDHPTIAIELEHIKFEITPAIFVSETEVKIPAPRTKELNWITSFPTRLILKLHERDLKYSGNLKPTIRLLKYWNYLQQRPFTSFEIEKQILEKSFECKTLSEYFFSGALSLMDIAKSDKQKKFIELIREKRRRLKILEVNSLNEYIEIELNSFLSE